MSVKPVNGPALFSSLTNEQLLQLAVDLSAEMIRRGMVDDPRIERREPPLRIKVTR